MEHVRIQPTPAATVIVLRPAEEGFEVLMVERHSRGFFGKLVVFPGGAVDEIDHSGLAESVINSQSEDRAFRAAAIRELAEETGLLALAGRVGGSAGRRGRDIYEAARLEGAALAGDELVLVSRWVTPEMAPRRFDTFFYLLPTVSTPPVDLDKNELVGHSWVTPAVALSRYQVGDWPMILPTLAHLRWLRRRGSIADAVDSARGADGRSQIEPHRADDGSLVPTLLPADVP